MTRILVFIATGAVATCVSLAYSAEKESGFAHLFDGKSLTGWEGKEGVFRVEKGAIVAGTLKTRNPNNEFLCTMKEYGDFELRLKAKLVGEGKNAGIQFRSQRIPNHHEVIGYQCDMGVMRDQSIWGALYDESRRRKFLAIGDDAEIKKDFKPGDWNELVLRCQGPRIQIWVNGYQTVDYEEADDKIARRGIIGLRRSTCGSVLQRDPHQGIERFRMSPFSLESNNRMHGSTHG